jgi:O-acetyl-ADP-ribose deacetylase (regulator of RNase III)
MIYIVNTNLFDSTADAWVNTVNCFGIMGKGIAKGFKEKFPDMFYWYKNICNKKKLKVGQCIVWNNHEEYAIPKTIINFPTKYHWKQPSRIEYIETGLQDLRSIIPWIYCKSISIPKLGCSNGGLKWTEVKPIIIDTLKDLENIDIYIHEYDAR